jgi:hypothetical protein
MMRDENGCIGGRVVAPGLLTTIQDLGRPGHQHLGIPVSGALDPISLRAANALVGNAPGTGALEVAYVGPTLVVEADDVRMSFVGARAAIEVLPDLAASAGTLFETMESIHLRRGNVVRIGREFHRFDMPEIFTDLIEHPDPAGPFGAKEVGQGPLLPIMPAVANAVYDAVGVRIDEVPITPEKIMKALEDKAKGKAGRYGPGAFPDIAYPEPMIVPTPWEGGDGNAVNDPERKKAAKMK